MLVDVLVGAAVVGAVDVVGTLEEDAVDEVLEDSPVGVADPQAAKLAEATTVRMIRLALQPRFVIRW